MLTELAAQLNHLHDAVHSWSLPWRLLFVLSWGAFAVIWTWSTMWITKRMLRRMGIRPKGPPPLAELLLCMFARGKDIDAIMGDFEEYYERDCANGINLRRAKFRYWGRVARSIGPQVWQTIKRLGLFGLIAAVLRR